MIYNTDQSLWENLTGTAYIRDGQILHFTTERTNRGWVAAFHTSSDARKTLLAAGWVEQVEHDGIGADYMVTKSNPSRGFVAPVVFPVFAKDIVKGDTSVIFETQYDQSVAKYQAEIDRLKAEIALNNTQERILKLLNETE